MAEGKPSASVVRWPSRSMREMRPVGPLWYGPTGGSACAHCSGVVKAVPAVPASAPYRVPSGPKMRPRGYSRPVANTETLAALTASLDEEAASVGIEAGLQPAATKAAVRGISEKGRDFIHAPQFQQVSRS